MVPQSKLASLLLGLAIVLSRANGGRAGTAFVPSHTRSSRESYGSRLPTYVQASRDSDSVDVTNEWGIPNSDSLPPLGGKSPRPSLPNGGRITLVGSGPGDPDLLTISAYKLLTDPSVLVISDRLVSQEILDLIPGQVKVARKLPGCAELAQEEIYWWAYQGLNEGKHVVRLKIGDPFVFGRGGEEVLKFRGFGVEPEVIPVSAQLIVLMGYGECRRVVWPLGKGAPTTPYQYQILTSVACHFLFLLCRECQLPSLLRCWGPSP